MHRVIWDSEAVDQLQRIYDEAFDKEAVVNAVTRVGLELAALPTDAGESREEGSRILFKYPIIVWFRHSERMRDVVVFRVRGY